MSLGQKRQRRTTQWERCCEILRHAGDDTFNRFAVRQDIGFGTTATGGETHATQGKGSGHQLEKRTTVDAIQVVSTRWEFFGDLCLKTGSFHQFIEAAPVAGTTQLTGGGFGMFNFAFHRWQPVQLWGGLIFQS